MYGADIGTIAICGCSQQVRLMILRTRRVVRGVSRRASLRTTCLGAWATFAIFTLWYSVLADCVSATWTAPPPMIAQPAAQADNFARAIRTDILVALFVSHRKREGPLVGSPVHLPQRTQSPVNAAMSFIPNSPSRCGKTG